jgi:hypothetical protein
MMTLEDFAMNGMKRSPRLYEKNKKVYRIHFDQLKLLLGNADKIKRTDILCDNNEKLLKLYRDKMYALYDAVHYLDSQFYKVLLSIKFNPVLVKAILKGIRDIMNGKYYSPFIVNNRMFCRFNRLNLRFMKKMRDYTISEWMKTNWWQVHALNRVLRYRNIPSDIYVYILKFYGDYTIIL